LWTKTVPLRTRLDDATQENHLERYLEVAGDVLNVNLEKAWSYPDQFDPVLAISGQEEAETLTILSVADDFSGTLRLTIDPAEVETVEKMFSASEDENEDLRQDGWVAVIDRKLFQISRVRSYDEESDPEGAVTIDVVTSQAIPASLEVRPPDLLFRLASNFGPTVDRADPPDFSRRAIYRHRLIRDLKVSRRMFDLLGEIYGFDIEVSNLYCITESWYSALRLSDPEHAYEIPVGSGMYYTDLPLLGFLFDQVPADVVSLDQQTDQDFALDIGPSIETDPETGLPAVDTNYWCFSVTTDALNVILGLGFWQIVDALGGEYYIEDFGTEAITDELTGVTTDGTKGPYAMTADRPPIATSSLTVKWDDKDGVLQTVTDDGLGVLSGDGVGTVDYDTGAISVTADEFTDGGTPSDWIPSSARATQAWNDSFAHQPPAPLDDTNLFVGWMVGDNGYVYKTSDGGVTWAVDGVFPFSDDHLNGVDGDQPTTLGADTTTWVVGEDKGGTGLAGVVFFYSLLSSTWTAVTNAIAGGLRDVYAFDGSSATKTILAVGYGGVMVYWTGAAMAQTGAAVTANDLNAVSMEDLSHVWVVGDAGTLLEQTAAWTPGDFATAGWTDRSTALGGGISDDLHAVAFARLDTRYGIVAGDNNEVWRTFNDGASWLALTTGFAKNWVAASWQGQPIAGSGGDNLILVADDGTVIKSTDNGVSWSAHVIPSGTHVTRGGSWVDTSVAVGTEHPYGLVVGEGDLTWYFSEDGRIPGAAGAEFLLDYGVDQVCVYAENAPEEGPGFLRLKAQHLCVEHYRPAAAYQIIAEPTAVLTEPGASVSNLVDRIEEKVNLYVPIHIRLLVFVINLGAAEMELWPAGGPVLDAQDLINDIVPLHAITGTLFDMTPADVEPLDEGAFLVTAQFKLNEVNWLRITSGTTTNLLATTGYDDGTVRFWAFGSAGVARLSTDGGVTWAADAGFPVVTEELNGSDNDYLKSGGTGNVVVCSENTAGPTTKGRVWLWDTGAGPAAWIELDNTAVDRGLLDCAMSGESNSGNFGRNALVCGYDGRMYYNEQTTDVLTLTGGGATTEHLRGCDMIDASANTFAVGESGTLLRVSAWGANPAGVWGTETWTDDSALLGPTTEHLNDINFNVNSTLDGIIVGENDAIFVTINAGGAWTARPTGSGKNFVAAFWDDFQSETSDYRVWAFTDDGTSFVSDDLGVTWTEEKFEDTRDINAAYYIDAAARIVVGDSGAVWQDG